MNNPAYSTLRIQEDVATLTLSREPANELHGRFLQELQEHIERVSKTDSLRALVIRSSTKGAFSIGLDAAYLLDRDGASRAQDFSSLMALASSILSLPVPVIGLLQGHALAGGAVIAACCDFRIMEEKSGRIGFTEAGVGLTIPHEMLPLLQSIIHPSRLAEATLLATTYKPHEAREAGLVTEVCEKGQGEKAISRKLQKIRSLPARSLASIRESLHRNTIHSLDRLTDLRTTAWAEFFTSPEFEEGLRSVVENRRPVFGR